VLDVKTAVLFATGVATWLLLGLAPLMAQQPNFPGAARPPVGGAGAPAAAPAGGGGAATAGAVGTSVTVIDIPFIFKGHARFKADMDNFKKEVEAFEAWARNEQTSLTKIRDEILTKYKPNSDEFKMEEERLAKLTSDLQIKMNVKKREMLELEAKIYYQTYNEIIAAVTKFCETNRISLVLRFSGDDIDANDRNSILQGVNRAVVYQRNLDISEMILQMVNSNQPRPQPRPTGNVNIPGTGPAPSSGPGDRNALRTSP
jgi:hypothetical protein